MTRFKPSREMFTPKNAVAVDCFGTDAAVYVYETAGRPCAVGFHGKAQRPDFHFNFRSIEAREAYIARYLEGRRAHAEAMEKRKTERRTKGRGLAVGDILRASWGYDQTNIDYYEVTALVGARMVEIRQIKCASVETAFMQGKSVPLQGAYVGEPVRKIADDGRVKVRDWGVWARKMEPKAEVGGVKVYGASHWTAYA